MQKGTVTKVYKLVIGDRFYKCKDRSRKVYEMVEAEPRRTAYRTYSYWAKQDNSDELIALKGDTDVFFLRHNENVPLPPPKRRLKPSLEYYTLRHAIK